MNIVYGITGGVGMGKTTVAKIVEESGFAVIDSDDISRELVEPGRPALKEIRTVFGDEFIGSDGQLDRPRMAELVFDSSDARTKLEEILHPRVRESWQASIEKWQVAGKSGVVIIPLLFEVGAQGCFNTILCVACTGETQRQRLRERGWSAKHIGNRIAAQMPIEKKMHLSDHVIWNEGDLESLHAQLTQSGCIE